MIDQTIFVFKKGQIYPLKIPPPPKKNKYQQKKKPQQTNTPPNPNPQTYKKKAPSPLPSLLIGFLAHLRCRSCRFS